MIITLKIDGKQVEAEKDSTILEAAGKNSIEIPTLCYHPALEPQGVCRLCTVEVIDGKRKRLVTACNYPVREGIEVNTKTDEVEKARKVIIELLLARCPNVEEIKTLARKYGIKKARFKLSDDNCILCGLCVRMCEQRMGRSAISLVGRGIELRVDTPFGILSDVCMACGACESICPTGAIDLKKITKHKVKPIPSEFNEGLVKRSPIYISPLVCIDRFFLCRTSRNTISVHGGYV